MITLYRVAVGRSIYIIWLITIHNITLLLQRAYTPLRHRHRRTLVGKRYPPVWKIITYILLLSYIIIIITCHANIMNETKKKIKILCSRPESFSRINCRAPIIAFIIIIIINPHPPAPKLCVIYTNGRF